MDVVPYLERARVVVELLHDALDHCRLAGTILPNKSYLVSTAEGKGGMIEYLMRPIGLAQVFYNDGEVSRAFGRGEAEVNVREIKFV